MADLHLLTQLLLTNQVDSTTAYTDTLDEAVSDSLAAAFSDTMPAAAPVSGGLPVWALVLVPTAIAFAMQAASIAKINGTVKQIGGCIKSREDLALVRQAINLSMRLAVLYIALYVVLIALLFYQAFATSLIAATVPLFLFGVLTLPMGLVGKGFERKLQELRVESGDSQIEATYRRWLIQWKEPRLQLPD